MLKIGLTGGIASGKSVAAARLRERGAVLVDADALAREVVEPGTEGLARVVAEFGGGVLDQDGRLDRPKLGALVFGNPERLAVLNGIVHPLVRSRAAAIVAAAQDDAVVVQDIPLLVETGQGSDFHLVVVVDAPEDIRLQRMLDHRGMTAEAARSRMGAQASREDRLAAADVVLHNSESLQDLVDQVDRLWDQRLVPFAGNLAAGARANRHGGPVLVPADPLWAQQAQRLMSRIAKALPVEQRDAVRLDHIGSTSVPGLEAKDVIDLQLTVPDIQAADALAPALAAAGFPVVPGITADTPKRSRPDRRDWQKRFHVNADPGRDVNLHVRAEGSAGWRFALCFRDWLRAEPAAAAEYLALKRQLAAAHSGDRSTAGYAEAKEDWFTAAEEALERWAEASGWQPPSSGS
ncbi:dephospho-CoA kinase [Pseudarthrobacter siccitolerans]|uniref:Dephospho-CoA kinase n=1 Tax=Pseudarthrobacter siccitolerans TaxID=861266 RepID=A0A024H3Y3_9MICC|nr:dephospho-CoA kinase [Pseudarthrobacter siccitolerans]CCQ46441.1 dephospho-CoA kinase [Pseudarthrobacter siccitolerans]